MMAVVPREGSLRAFIFLGLFLFAPTAFADEYDQARAWLERMAKAMHGLSYQGTFVYLRGEDMDTLRITHVKDAHGTRERLVSLSGPHREILRDAQGVRRLRGDVAAAAGDQAPGGAIFPEFPPEALREARSRYLFEVGRTGRIAGHNGRRIAILPRDQYRYGYDLWLEEETGLLLRWVLYDAERRSLAKLMFTELRIGDEVDGSELDSPTPPSQFQLLSPVPDEGRTARPETGGLPSGGIPPGFELAARTGGGRDGRSEHLVFSDGLATVSVYIEPGDGTDSPASGLSRLGTTNAWTLNENGLRVTAIGDVPAVTVRQIGSAFHASLR